MPFSLKDKAHKNEDKKRIEREDSAVSFHDVGKNRKNSRVIIPRRDSSKCFICKSSTSLIGSYLDRECGVVYEDRVCDSCGFVYTVRREIDEQEKISLR